MTTFGRRRDAPAIRKRVPMQILRSALFLLTQITTAVLFTPVALAAVVLPSLPRARVIGGWARFNIWALRRVCGITCEVSGAQHLPAGPAVIISNHQSAWETLFFQRVFPPQSYILKAQLLWIPLFGWGLAANRPVAINRARKVRALEQLVRGGRARLAEGRWLVVFPEGTRRPPGAPGKFQAGGALLAVKAGAPVVPVAHNAGVFWPKQAFLKRPGVIRMRIGPAIPSAAMSARELNAQVERWIRDALLELPGCDGGDGDGRP